MASRKPSDRRRGGVDDLGEPNLAPIMNIAFMLILALLVMSAAVPLGLIGVQAPRIDGPGPGTDKPKPEKPPLQLTIFVTKAGFSIGASGATLDGRRDGRVEGTPLFPTLGEGKFDFPSLHKELVKIKKAYPKETDVLIIADEDIRYEDIVKTMDASRDYKNKKGDTVLMFPGVAFSAGIVG